MTFPKCSKRLGQFEFLESKKLFAADLAGIATPAEVAICDPSDCPSLGGQEGEPITGPNDDASVINPYYHPNLGGQEGEPVIAPVSDMVFENLSGQEGEDIVDRVFQIGYIPAGCVYLHI